MSAYSKMSLSSDKMSSNSNFSIIPRVDITSNEADELKFTLSGVNVSIANAIRRTILSDIPMVVFRVSPYEKNKCNIISNSCGLNNEIVKHRLSCIPIHIKDLEEFPIKNYIMELNVQNITSTNMVVTTKDFTVKDVVSGKYLSEDKVREIFPANSITGDYIDFVRLKGKQSDELQAKVINLTCSFDIGTAKEDGAYNSSATCAYGNTIDDIEQEKRLQQLKQKWKEEGKNEKEIDFEAANWKLLEGKRIFKKDSFDFIIQSVGVHTNNELLIIACKLISDRLTSLNTSIDTDGKDTDGNLKISITSSNNTMENCFDVVIENEDYTIGKIIEYFLLETLYETKIITYCGFKIVHPHNSNGLLRIAYRDPVEVSSIKGNLKECIGSAVSVFDKLKKEFLKLAE